MKKKTAILLVVALVVILSVALAACDPASGGNHGGNQGGTVDTLSYTVTFDTNGGDTSFASYTITNVPSGSYVSAPKREDGTTAVPVKKGYTFKYWSYKSTEFGFAGSANPTPVEENITLTAYYEANEYTLTLNPADETYDGALTIDGVEGAFSQAIVKTVKYDTTAANLSLDVPKTDAEEDYFVYWYYYEKGDVVPFTVWATESSATVQMKAKYTFTHGLDLYPLFHSQLPDYDVILDKNFEGTTPLTVTVKQSDYLKTDAFAEPVRDGYRFAGWYYETTDEEGNVTQHDFTVYDVTEGADNSKATKIDSALVTEKEGGNSFIVLKAKWIKTVTVSSPADLERVRGILNGDQEASVKAEYASAEYTLTTDLTLAGWTYLFDESLPFTGVFDGGYHTITISSFAADADGVYALFGFVSGTVKNLNVAAGGITLPTENAAALCVIGGIAAYAKNATLENCTASVSVGADNRAIDFGASNVYVGALVGASKDGLTVKGGGGIGAAANLYSSLSAYIATTGNAYVGGLVGGSFDVLTSGGSFEKCNVTTTVDVTAANAYVGGFVGNAQGFDFTECEVGGSITATATAEAYVGAFAGRTNFGGISRCTTSGDAPFAITVNGGNAYVGGVAGDNKVTLANCRVNATINVTANGARVYVGGVTGMERGSAVDSCYVTGTVSVKLLNGVKNAYVAGAAGYSSAATAFSRVYNELDITVVNDAKAAVKAGNFLAYYNSALTPTVEKVYYFESNAITVNGAALSDEEKTSFEKVEVLTSEKREEVPNWAIGGDYLNLDGGYWEIVEGEVHPSLRATETEEENPDGEEGEEGGEDAGDNA